MNHRQKNKAKKKVKSDNRENSVKAKKYNCSACTNSYALISGLRGHLRKKNMELQTGLGSITLQCNRLNYRLLCPKYVIDYNGLL